MRIKRTMLLVLVLLASLVPSTATASTTAGSYEGSLPNGTTWIGEVPEDWNGTVLLFSHGYLPTFIGVPNLPAHSPGPDAAEALLDRGFALVGSSYAAAGWALETAPQDQLDSLAAFIGQVGEDPDRVLAYGFSMGGLVTTKIVEIGEGVIDGALPMCGIVGGGLALNNYQLDGAHAIDVLLAPNTDIKLADYASFDEAFASTGQLLEALGAAQATPEGRARTALAAALFQVSDRVGDDPPRRNDLETIQQNLYENLSGIVPFVVPARVDIETAMGGNASWNAGVDYRKLLRQSSLYREVAALYRNAGLDLGADLRLLTQTADVVGDADAIDNLFETSVPTGRLGIPVLSMHTVADSLVPVNHEEGYEDLVLRAGSGRYLRQAFVDRVGHCTFTTAEVVAAVQALDSRVDTGRWGGTTTPGALQQAAEATGLGPAAFVHEPARYQLLGDRTDALVDTN